jgi:2-iminobutanoate/2-iminopropanoate deaminase
MRTVITVSTGAPPVGPYSQAILANGLLFVSGQIPLDPSTGRLVPGGIAEQTDRVLQNISTILGAADSSATKVVRCVVYLANMDDFDVMNTAYAKFFRENPPARTTVEVSRLPKGALIEIEATAVM